VINHSRKAWVLFFICYMQTRNNASMGQFCGKTFQGSTSTDLTQSDENKEFVPKGQKI